MLNLQNVVAETLAGVEGLAERQFTEVNVLVSGKDEAGETLVIAQTVNNGLSQVAVSTDVEQYNAHHSLALSYFAAASVEAEEALQAEA